MVEVVCFDLGETLIREEREDSELRELGARKLYEILNERGLKLRFEDFKRVHDALWREAEGARESMREIDVVNLFYRLLEGAGLEPDQELLQLSVNAYFRVKLDYVELYPDSIPALEELKDEGYKLALISNAMPSNRLVYEELGLERFFEVALFSYEQGIRKPHPEIFMAALERLGAGPGEAAMVGNDPVSDIAGAGLLGMETFLVVRKPISGRSLRVLPDHLVSDLRAVPELLEGRSRGSQQYIGSSAWDSR